MANVVWDGDEAGAASRYMLAQDVKWISDAMLSASTSKNGWFPLVLLGHGARVVYEGTTTIRSTSPTVGNPELAQRLDDRYSDVIARARHGGKFLDDNKKSFDVLCDEISRFYDAHRTEFTGNAFRFARLLETDLGLLLSPRGRLLSSTITQHFRMGIESGIRLTDAGPLMGLVAQEMGQALSALAEANGSSSELTGTMDFEPLEPLTTKDRRATRYLEKRYDPAATIVTKLLLLMVEGEVNTTELVLPIGEAAYPESVFRARMVSVFHCLRAVQEILESHPAAQSEASREIRSLLDEAPTRRVLQDPGIRKVRNRSMHYEIRDRSIQLDSAEPMFGIVHSCCPGTSFEDLNSELCAVNGRLAECLHNWQSDSSNGKGRDTWIGLALRALAR